MSNILNHFKQRIQCCCILFAAVVLMLQSCGTATENTKNNIHFIQLDSSFTGIDFNNRIAENDSVNLLTNEYLYTGSGIGIGDFNNDHLPDIFFGGNQKPSRLYINKGNFQFEDITAKAGISADFWATGISVVDINNDGFDDIYVCASGSKDAAKRKNHLFINNGNKAAINFSEQAEEYGLADTGFSTQAAFFDYDKDGDLDMYLLRHQLYNLNPNTIVSPTDTIHAQAADKLFRNEGVLPGSNHPLYKDVSAETGIKEFGYGLGVVVSDFNNDNWPDVYVANDYIANDILWLNNHNGTFSDALSRAIKHTSYSSMGVDAADINNDGLPDIISLDMQPENNERQKMMFSFMNDDRFEMEHRAGYQYEFMRNMLQLNNGVRIIHDTAVPFFSEIGQLAGIHETDWSWSVLIADLNNDGTNDIHITNGMGRDMLNKDFVAAFKNNQQISGLRKSEISKIALEKLTELGMIELKDYCYQNNGNLSFTNVSKEAGIDMPAVSNGCAYADLDNDGDLDLVVNIINKAAFVFKNEARQTSKDTIHNYLTIELNGNSLNKNGFSAKVFVYTGKKIQFQEQNPVRGYMSTVDKRLHFGVDNITMIDSVKVIWPDDKTQTIKSITSDTMLTLYQKNATNNFVVQPPLQDQLFADISGKSKIDFKHIETFFNDFSFQRLLPQKYSQLGPFITSGDVNGDGLTDFFIGGAYNQSGRIFIQQKDGSFTSKDLEGNKEQEDLGCLLFDADGDKDADLFINSGSYEYDAGSPDYLPRIYLNDGKGNFTQDKLAIPQALNTSAQSVAASDYDSDGDMDLFIGGRVSPNNYPVSPRSYILQNNQGKFTDVTEQVCPQLIEPGMVAAAIWTDFNNDKKQDLIIAGEFMPVRFFKNDNGKLNEITAATGLKNINGQWRSLCAADIDKDGDQDIVAGNLGLNNTYKASASHPIKLFAKDIDANGSIDPVFAYYNINQQGDIALYPAIGRDQFAEQVPFIKKKYLYHKDYSTLTIDGLFSKEDRENMQQFTCDETRTCWFENKGNETFMMHALPLEAQIAPVNAILCTDADEDGNPDIILAGNEYQASVMIGRYDASYGLFLKGNGKGNFTPVAPLASGLIIDGDVKDLAIINTAQQKILLAAVNGEKAKTFSIKQKLKGK